MEDSIALLKRESERLRALAQSSSHGLIQRMFREVAEEMDRLTVELQKEPNATSHD
jgi:hypothetical protein